MIIQNNNYNKYEGIITFRNYIIIYIFVVKKKKKLLNISNIIK